METIYYALYTLPFVDEEGKITDEKRITYSTDIDQIYLFKGKHNYHDDNSYMCELREEYGELVRVEGSELDY